MFSRVRAPGLWVDGTTVPGTQWEQFDANLANALDGADGGTYSLSAPMVIGGAPGVYFEFDLGVAFDEAVVMNDNLDVFGNVYFGGVGSQTFAVQADVTFSDGSVTIGASGSDALTVESFTTFNDVANFDGDTFFTAAVDFNGAVRFDGNLDINSAIATIGTTGADALTINSFTQFNDVVSFNGTALFSAVTFQVPIGFSGTGKIKWRNKTISVTGNQSVVAANYDFVYIPAATMAAGETITIDDTSAQDGMRIEFSTNDTNTINIATPAGLTVPLLRGAGSYQTVAFQRVSGTWRVANYGLHN